MAKQSDPMLDLIFAALADPTRRDIVIRLAEGPAPVKDLAHPHAMALSSFLKHVAVLERAGLVTTRKSGRSRICQLTGDGFRPVETWMSARRRRISGRIDGFTRMMEGLRAAAPKG